MQRPTVILAYALILASVLSLNPALAQHKDLKQLTERFDELLSEQFKSNKPGATALVAWNGQIIYEKAFGMANLELTVPMHVVTVFKIASITKQFTAVAVLQLAEQGKLSLKDEITKFIPDYPTEGNKITIEHLLTQTSGIRNYSTIRDTVKRGAVDFTPKEMVDYFKNQPMRFAPGTKWEYSNSNYVLLGYIIEIVTGKTYGDYLAENLLKPAGMTHSLYASDIQLVMNRADGYAKSDRGFVNVPYLSMTQPYAAGSILSTVEDLFKWNQAVHSNRLITRESLDRALTRYTLADGKETSYGYGWRFGYIQDSPSIWHGGSINGFVAMAMYLPKEDVFVAVFSNCENNSPEDVTAKLAALAIGKPYEYKAIPTDNAALSHYAGVYENDNGQLRIITAAENRLYSQIGRGPKVNVQAYQTDKFSFEDNVFQTLAFKRNAAGEVENLLVMNRQGIEAWKKSNKPIPSMDGIKLNEKMLESYIGEYEIRPEFTFTITKEQGRLFIQATGQDKLELFAETETTFFLKVNDAQLEFVKDNAGNVKKAILRQGGKITDAKKMRE